MRHYLYSLFIVVGLVALGDYLTFQLFLQCVAFVGLVYTIKEVFDRFLSKEDN